MPNETCDGCGFDAAAYSHEDLLGTVRALAPMWRHTTEGIGESVLTTRPASGVWSALEYASHSRDVTGVMGYLLHLALTEDHPVLEPPPPETRAWVTQDTSAPSSVALSRMILRNEGVPT